MADKILATASEKAKGGRLRAVEETIASVTVEKYREMEEEVDQSSVECRQGLDRSVSEAWEKYEAEEAEG